MYQYKYENTLFFYYLIVILGAFYAPACVRPYALRTLVRIAYGPEWPRFLGGGKWASKNLKKGRDLLDLLFPTTLFRL